MPAKKTKRIRSRGGLPPNKYLSDGQVKLLRQYLTRKVNGATLSGPWPVRPFINSMIVDLLLNSGLRAAELCDLQLRDLPGCHGKPIIDVRKGKGRIQRSIFISDALTERLKKFIRLHRRAAKPKSYLFVNELNFGRLSPASLRSKLRIIGDAAGLGRLNPHRFRHTYATHLYKSCQDLLFVSDQLGHKDPETTAIYAKTASDLRQKFANGFGRWSEPEKKSQLPIATQSFCRKILRTQQFCKREGSKVKINWVFVEAKKLLRIIEDEKQ